MISGALEERRTDRERSRTEEMTLEGCPHAKDLDYWDSERLQEPFELFKELRDAECPISKSEMHGGYYIASRWEDVAAVAHDFDTYISGKGISIPAFSEENGMFPQETDKPLHDEYRRVVAPRLRPKAVAELEPTMRRLTNGLIDEFIESGNCEITADLASPLVMLVFGPMIGLDEKYWAGLQGIAFEMMYGEDKDEGTREFLAFIKDQFEQRRENPREDLLTEMLDAEIVDGDETRKLTEHERLQLVWGLSNAAGDTTSGLTTTAIWYLAKHPELKQRFVDDPDLVARNLDEFIRMCAVITVSRTVSAPTTLAGVDLVPEDKVAIMLGAAGRDERAFENPEEFQFDRKPNKHLAFGLGIHKCVGMHLARLQFKVTMEELLRRIPDYDVTADEDVVITAGPAWQVRVLPLRFEAREREGAAVAA
jgi:cytochrome P450